MNRPDFVSAMDRITEGATSVINAVFDQAPYGVYVDEPSHGCTYANPALLDQFGVSWEEFAGYGWARHIFAEDAERMQALIQEYEHSHEPIDAIYRVRGHDQPRYVRARVSAILNESGQHVGSLGLTFDVTEQQLFEENVVQSQKLAAIGQLSARLAHDLNNLLTAIIGSAELMAREIDTEKSAHHMNTLELAFEQARQLTGPLLTLTRQRIISQGSIDLDPQVQQLGRLLAGTLGEGIDMQTNLHAAGCHVPLDQTQLGQILLNLATNGSDAMGGHGTLTINTRGADDHVVLEVIDEGDGLTPDTMTHAFDAFFTTKEAGRGSGLGLATVRHLVEFAGGKIALLPADRRGTIARVELPCVEADLYGGVGDQATLRTSSYDADGAVVLVVEDQEAVRQSLAYSLALANFEVHAAGNLAEAHTRLVEIGQPSMIITDVMLPDGHGTELIKVARQRQPRMPVIYTSGFAGRGAADIDLTDPAIRYVAKPFRAQDIMQAIRQLRA